MALDVVPLTISVLVRVVAIYGKWFFTRPEVSTPLNSWTRLTEGVHLYKSGASYCTVFYLTTMLTSLPAGLSPYSGVVFHETPLTLAVFSVLGCDPDTVSWMFIAADLVTAALLYKVGEAVASRTLLAEDAAVTAGRCHPEAKSLLMSLSSSARLPRVLALAYLLNPYTVASCSALTATVWTNLLLAASLLALVRGRGVLGAASLALATYQGLYPCLLLVPLALAQYQHRPSASTLAAVLGTFLASLCGLQLISFYITGDWSYLDSVYGFILTVPELTPNMGIFWYFFTEMFDHFRVFFLCTFQINLLLYVAPLSIKFPDQPLLLSTVIIGLIAVFKSYPSLGDVGFFLSLLPLFSHLLPFMKQTFIIICMLLASSVLAPIAWQLWIYNNSANANYYFAINLVYSTAQIFLITDLLFGHVKREFYLKNGFSLLDKEDKNGDKPVLHLK